MRGEASRSGDAALRRLLRELDSVEPPADFDNRLRARLEERRRSTTWSLSLFTPGRSPRPVACAALLLLALFGARLAYDLDGSTAPDTHGEAPIVATAGDEAGGVVENAVAPSRVVVEHDPAGFAEVPTLGVERRFRFAATRRGADRGKLARRLFAASVRASGGTFVRRDAAPLPAAGPSQTDGTGEVAASVSIHARAVPVMSRDAGRGARTLMLSPISFGDAPLAYSARRREAPHADARPGDTRAGGAESQSAW